MNVLMCYLRYRRYRYRRRHRDHWMTIQAAVGPLDFAKRRALHLAIRNSLNAYRHTRLSRRYGALRVQRAIRLGHLEARDTDVQRGLQEDLLRLIARLGGVFETTTGQPVSPQSRFVEFLRPALSLAGPARVSRISGYALDGLIERSRSYKKGPVPLARVRGVTVVVPNKTQKSLFTESRGA